MKDKLKPEILDKFKYPILVLALGIILMLVPSSNSDKSVSETSEDALLSHILTCTQGVGTAEVLISDSGVVVVCKGADSAKIKLDIIRAVSSYTGYSSDKITILKMAD